MKMKNLKAYKIEDVPDHVIEEVNSLSEKLYKALIPYIKTAHPNVALAAFNFIHAAMIKHLISDDEEEIQKAVSAECKALIKNVNVLIDLKNERDST